MSLEPDSVQRGRHVWQIPDSLGLGLGFRDDGWAGGERDT
jgi:hypothetical protein